MPLKSAKKTPERTGSKSPMSTSGRINFDAITPANIKQVFVAHAARTRPLMQELDRENSLAIERMRHPDTRALEDEVRKLKAKVKKLESAGRRR